MHGKRILIFDAYAGGHHGQYVQMLMNHWVGRGLKGELELVLTPSFPVVFPDVAEFARRHSGAGITLTTGRQTFDAPQTTWSHFIKRDLRQGKWLRDSIRKSMPDHCLLMFFDHLQLSLWLDLKFDFPVSISGIYFSPSFHYGSIGWPPTSPGDRFKRRRKRSMLARALSNRHFHTLFSLDPFAVPHINAMSAKSPAVQLPDGVPIDGLPVLVPSLVTSPNKLTALLFGGLNRRKGLMRVLEALHFLRRDVQRSLHLVLAGPVHPDERQEAYAAIERTRNETDVEIYFEDRFVPDDLIQSYAHHADVILVAYQGHVGSSNVLIRAAAAGKPVLGSDYGVVGEQIRRRRLGLAVDTMSAEKIAQALSAFVEDAASVPFDLDSARQFAEENTAEAYGREIFTRLLSME